MEVPDHVAVVQGYFLSRHRRTDVEELVKNLSNWNIAQWLLRPPFPYTHENANEWHDFLEEEKTKNPESSRFRYVIRDASARLVGDISLVPTAHGSYRLGYWLAEELWGQGIMTKAVGALIAVARVHEEAKEIYAEVKAHNLGSKHVLQKNGFRVFNASETREDGPWELLLDLYKDEPSLRDETPGNSGGSDS